MGLGVSAFPMLVKRFENLAIVADNSPLVFCKPFWLLCHLLHRRISSCSWSLRAVQHALQCTYHIRVHVQMTLNPDCTVVEVPRFAPEEWGNALDWYDATVRACQHTRIPRECAPVSSLLPPD